MITATVTSPVKSLTLDVNEHFLKLYKGWPNLDDYYPPVLAEGEKLRGFYLKNAAVHFLETPSGRRSNEIAVYLTTPESQTYTLTIPKALKSQLSWTDLLRLHQLKGAHVITIKFK